MRQSHCWCVNVLVVEEEGGLQSNDWSQNSSLSGAWYQMELHEACMLQKKKNVRVRGGLAVETSAVNPPSSHPWNTVRPIKTHQEEDGSKVEEEKEVLLEELRKEGGCASVLGGHSPDARPEWKLLGWEDLEEEWVLGQIPQSARDKMDLEVLLEGYISDWHHRPLTWCTAGVKDPLKRPLGLTPQCRNNAFHWLWETAASHSNPWMDICSKACSVWYTPLCEGHSLKHFLLFFKQLSSQRSDRKQLLLVRKFWSSSEGELTNCWFPYK